MKRPKERLEEIDKYLADHYKKDGGRACADALGEKITYISSRIQMLRTYKKAPDGNKEAKPSELAILSGKVTAKNREIEHLWELLRKERIKNKELRIENIRLITGKVKRKVKNDKNNT